MKQPSKAKCWSCGGSKTKMVTEPYMTWSKTKDRYIYIKRKRCADCGSRLSNIGINIWKVKK